MLRISSSARRKAGGGADVGKIAAITTTTTSGGGGRQPVSRSKCCDWCGGDRERVVADLVKLRGSKAGSGWMGVRNPGVGGGVGGKGVPPGGEGGWDAKRYYQLAGGGGDDGGREVDDEVGRHPRAKGGQRTGCTNK